MSLSIRLARLFCAALLGICFSANAAIRINVNTFADDFGSDGAHCSLREALYAISKQAAFGGCTLAAGGLFNSVGLSSGTYVMSLPPVPGNAAAGGAFYLNSSIVLQGAGAGLTFIDAQSIDSVFVVAPGAGIATVMIDLTLQGGRSASNVGAGIYHKNGKIQMQRVVVRNDTGGYGIYSLNTEGLTLSQVTVSGHDNTGVYIDNNQTYSSTNSIVNTTISGNVAQTQPGGLYLYGGNGHSNVTTVSNSTIAFNTGRADGQNVRSPGGVAVYGANATLYLRNSILARNLRGSREPEDCDADSATIISQGYNIIERAPYCTFQGATSNDILGIAPQLAPLFDYGGGVPTHAVYPGTLARAAGNPAAPGSGGAACETIDARSIARTGAACDIGAYQYHADFTAYSVDDISDYSPGDGVCATTSSGYPCTLRAAIDEANVATAPVTIELPQGVYKITKPALSHYIDNVDGSFDISSHQSVTIVGAGAGKTIIDAAGLDQVMQLGNYGFDAVALHGLTLRNGDESTGGGVQVYDGAALLDGVRVTSNKACQGNGVWLSSQADVTISASAIDNNTWDCTTGGGGGGGIYVSTGGRLHLINSTIANNKSTEGGGGIYNFGGTVDMAYTTIAGNLEQSASPDGGIGGSGGTYRIINSIIANNLSKSGTQPAQEADCAATVQALGYTFFRSTANCTIGQSFYAISGYDPLLAPLDVDSGSTPTAQLLPQSPLVTATSQKSECVDTNGTPVLADQLGVDRPNFYDWGNPDYCIMGAYQGTRDRIFADGFEAD